MIKIILKENRRLLNEITMEQAIATLNSKATRKIIYRYSKQIKEKTLERNLQKNPANRSREEIIKVLFTNNSVEPTERDIDIGVNRLGELLTRSIPTDITDAQRALSFLWLKRQILGSYNYYRTSDLNPEAFTAYKHDIESFFHLQRLIEPPEKRDLNNIQSLGELETLVHDVREQEHARQRAERTERERQQALKNRGAVDNNYANIEGVEFLGSGDGFKVFIPETFEAACEIGAQGWCTTRSRNMFNRYSTEDDPLFIFINEEDPSRKYQFNYGADGGTGQFMDKDNYPVPNNIRLKLHEILLSLDVQERFPIINKMYPGEDDDYNSGEGEPF